MAKELKTVEVLSDMTRHDEANHDGEHDDGHDDGHVSGHDDGHDDDHGVTIIHGTNQADEIVTKGGPQHVIFGNGGDAVSTGGGPDIIETGNGKDTLDAGGGPDKAMGGNGKDIVEGGCGPDILVGGNGKDVLIGGKGPDMLTGGHGADLFVYTAMSDAPAHGGDHGEDHGGDHEDEGGDSDGGTCSGPPRETITDFEIGSDKIDLRMLPNVSAFSDEPVAYSVWVEQAGDDAMVMIDLNGSVEGGHAAEMAILLEQIDASALSADDFIL